MRRIPYFLLVAAVGAGLLPVTAPARAAGDTFDLVVTLDRPATPAAARRLAALGTDTWTARHFPVAALRLPGARLEALRRLAGVERIYPNRRLRYFGDHAVVATAATGTAATAPPAPRPPALPGQAPPGAFGAALPVPNLGVTGQGVTVAIIDSGVDFTHPDLAPAMVANVKISPLGPDGPVGPLEGLANTDNSSGHGTHVAGDVAGRGTASDGAYRGSAPGASLVGLGAGEGLTVHTRGVLQAYDWMLENRQRYGIRVVNNSFGGPFEPFDPEEPINQATKAAADAGIVVLFAQGNDGDEMTMNGNATPPWVIAVAAGTRKGGMTDFSSGGIDADVADPADFDVRDRAGDPRRPLRMGLYHPSITALGEYVVGARAAGTVLPLLAARHDAALDAGEQLHYTIMSGTSMAAPEAAGIVALLLEANPALRPGDVKRVLQITARWIAGVPFYRQGYGYADPAAAVGLARELAGRPAEEVDRVLADGQASRDASILAAMPRPIRASAWWKGPVRADGDGPEGARLGEDGGAPDAGAPDAGRITVDASAGRLKVLNAGFSVPFLPDPAHVVIVRDAAGREVARSQPRLPGGSGTIVLDLDLTRLEGLTWGQWTVEVGEGGLVPAGFFGIEEVTVAATFARPQPPEPMSSILPSPPAG